MPVAPRPEISIVIKALNEEKHIAAAIESALAALDGLNGEVILADSASSDRTIEIARQYPIRIVSLQKPEQRSCGAGSQLGYQYSSGQYVCQMDGDMRLHRDYLPAAIRFLKENPAAGGVGGYNIDRELSNLEFAQRSERKDPDRGPGQVMRLNGSGVYRRAAIASIGYLTDRNLHGGEELDLAARLHCRGWTLARLGRPAVDHYGHTGGAYRLLLHRIASRNSFGTGEVFRAALGQPHFRFVVRNDRNLAICLLVAAWWLAIAVAIASLHGMTALVGIAALVLAPVLAMSLRWRSFHRGLYSVAAWNMFALSFLPGFLRSRIPPAHWIDSTVVKEIALEHPASEQGGSPVPAMACGGAHRVRLPSSQNP
jgi:glycosyltransferase involved in cell wall biosynthesis